MISEWDQLADGRTLGGVCLPTAKWAQLIRRCSLEPVENRSLRPLPAEADQAAAVTAGAQAHRAADGGAGQCRLSHDPAASRGIGQTLGDYSHRVESRVHSILDVPGDS